MCASGGIFYGQMKKTAKQMLAKRRADKTKTELSKVPEVLQLPGGVRVRAFDFRVTRVDAQFRAVAFELAEPGTDSDCVLWAHDAFLGDSLRRDLRERLQERHGRQLATVAVDLQQTDLQHAAQAPAFTGKPDQEEMTAEEGDA